MIPNKTFSIDFLKYRPLFALFSLLIFASLVGGLIYKQVTYGRTFVYSVDFTGGTQVLLGFSQPVTGEKISCILEGSGITGAVTRSFSDKEMLIRVREYKSDAKGLASRIQANLQEALPENAVTIKQVDSVGAGVGASLWFKAMQAIIVGLLVLLLYTWWRFWSVAFGVGVVVSLFHDAVVILAFFLLFDLEISLNVIGAILALLGYSINDTIVIFSRIRENIKRMRGVPLETVINSSINETLRRTILTSLSTMLVVLSLFLFGGEALRTLALALLIGIVFGTYSSIAIASPVMLLLHRKK